MTFNYVLKNKKMIALSGKNPEMSHLNVIHRQGHSSRSDILPPKWYILKNKMKEKKYIV